MSDAATTDHASRRQKLRSEVAATRSEAKALRDQILDATLEEFVTQVVLNPLDNIDSLWLGTKTDSEAYAALFLNAAEAFLAAARKQLAITKAQIEQYGGPAKVMGIS